ncbi:MAG: type II toxin-antitoxin system PemK/MazF family toxin [Candidatus Hydrogenedentes bacterium]|nr:type II toxin-antitoxin system PemK/MazF family toxin [Candidatus Hydrogenedentota bacterium]
MHSCSRNDIVLVRYPFTGCREAKIRPAVVVSAPHTSLDVFLVPLTSRTSGLLDGEFVLADFRAAGLHVPTAVKRGLYTLHSALVLKKVGTLSTPDIAHIESAWRLWLGLA